MGAVGFPAAGLGGVSVVSRWCLVGVWVSVVSRWCFGGASMMSLWCHWSRSCFGGVSAASMLIQGVHAVLAISWWRRVGVSGRLCWWSVGYDDDDDDEEEEEEDDDDDDGEEEE